MVSYYFDNVLCSSAERQPPEREIMGHAAEAESCDRVVSAGLETVPRGVMMCGCREGDTCAAPLSSSSSRSSIDVAWISAGSMMMLALLARSSAQETSCRKF